MILGRFDKLTGTDDLYQSRNPYKSMKASKFNAHVHVHVVRAQGNINTSSILYNKTRNLLLLDVLSVLEGKSPEPEYGCSCQDPGETLLF